MAASVARNGLKALCGVVIVAALAMTSTAKAGLIGTGSASYCDPTAAQVFAPWNDSSSYASLFNGGFEGGSAGWYLSGGARVVSGNEPFFVESSTRQPLPAPARGQLGDERHGVLRAPATGTCASSPGTPVRGRGHCTFRSSSQASSAACSRCSTAAPSAATASGRRRRVSSSCSATSPACWERGRLPSASPRSAGALPSRSTTSIWIPGKTAEPAPSLDSRPWSDRCPWPSGLAAPSG